MTQLEAALREGSVFVVREDGLGIVARRAPGPPSGLVFYDLRTCLRAVAAAKKPKPKRRAGGEEDGDGRCVGSSGSPCWSAAPATCAPPRGGPRARPLDFDDGSMVTLADDAPDAQPLLALARPAL